tara:strand:- start:4 stop:285 length:282 start_codon:yes stop_codon:yes gene_type:complete
MVTPKPYEKRLLNGEPIVVVFKKEGVKGAREKYPNTPIYSIREIEALDGLETVEQRLLQEARRIFGGQIFSEEFFNKHYKIRKVKRNGKKQRV